MLIHGGAYCTFYKKYIHWHWWFNNTRATINQGLVNLQVVPLGILTCTQSLLLILFSFKIIQNFMIMSAAACRV